MQAILLGTITTCVWVSLLFAPTTASAQVTDSLATLQSSIRAGDRLRITDRAGVVTNGKLLGLSLDTLQLTLSPGRSFQIAEPSLARVERVTRATVRGVIIGLFIGAATGVVAVAEACNRGCYGPGKNEWMLPVAGVFGGIGAGVGALIGSAIPVHRLVYENK